jgi:rSAM/selenodomain-associated transferase 1
MEAASCPDQSIGECLSFPSNRRERLIVFARFPEPGKTKTRLIPGLGAHGACAMHFELTRRTMELATRLRVTRGVDWQVRFAGGNVNRMQQLFGHDMAHYLPQNGADLGERLQDAVTAAFLDGVQRLIVIGTDCPEIESKTLTDALEALNQHDVILGPAYDGGYYLIGLRVDRPGLFQEIEWSTERVLAQTLDRCRDGGYSTHLLQTLSDIDHTEDLLVCRRIRDGFTGILPAIHPKLISVIIPTLNVEQFLERTLNCVLGIDGLEVIIVDGGSSDRTIEIARRAGATVIQANRGRESQMNAGAALAHGEVLLFLHSGTLLPVGFDTHVWSIIDRGAAGVAFRFRIDSVCAGLNFIEWDGNWQTQYCSLAANGEQGLVLRATDFYEVCGFKN